MARLSRLAVAGLPHHVIQRGNNRQPIFVDAEDHVKFLQCLRDASLEQGLAIHAYVLMPNHVHLLVTPEREETLARVMQSIGRRYVRWFNDRHARTGTLWEGRFRSSVVEAERYFLACSRYIELNPVRAALAADPLAFPWSSYAHHVGQRVDPLITDHSVYWELGNTPFERQAHYRALFDSHEDRDFLARIRHDTNRGMALGDGGFLLDMPALAARAMPSRPRGRPKKEP